MKALRHKLFVNTGQALVEVVFAIGMMALVVIGLIKVSTIALKNAQFAKNQARATEYARKAMEEVRQERDQNPIDFWNRMGTFETDLGNDFTEKVKYNEIVPDQKMRVEVLIIWEDAKGEHDSELITYFTKWGSIIPMPTP